MMSNVIIPLRFAAHILSTTEAHMASLGPFDTKEEAVRAAKNFQPAAKGFKWAVYEVRRTVVEMGDFAGACKAITPAEKQHVRQAQSRPVR